MSLYEGSWLCVCVDSEMYKQTDRQIDRQTDRQTGRQTGRQTDGTLGLAWLSSKYGLGFSLDF